MPEIDDALLDDNDGVILSIEVTPGSKQDLFPAGFNEWRKTIGCLVKAPAIDGKANKAVITLISSTLGVSGSSVSIVTGFTSSRKKVKVVGITKSRIVQTLFSEKQEKRV